MSVSTVNHHLKDKTIRSRKIRNVNGLDMHILEAGYDDAERPLVLLLHGFPELAFSWRKIIGPLAQAGFHVVAPDQRGYGLTTGWDASYDTDLEACQMTGLATDILALTHALGYCEVNAVVGHDFGSPVAAWCALIRPDIFKSVVLMSAPFSGPPAIDLLTSRRAHPTSEDVHSQLLAQTPPRKHYQWYYSERHANDDMLHCNAGLRAFLRAYYHVKSADWTDNQPYELSAWTGEELARLPTYYVMHADQDMAETVLPHAPSDSHAASCDWLSNDELQYYVETYQRTGFQGGLNWYRCRTSGLDERRLTLFANQRITVPSRFIAGISDWGIHQAPGALNTMQTRICTNMDRVELIDGAGHWVQQEQPEAVTASLVDFLSRNRKDQ